MAEITVTPEQWRELVMPLSSAAFLAFILCKNGLVDRHAIGFARRAKAEEIAAIDWLGMLAGVPEESPEWVIEDMGKSVMEEISGWLMGGTN